MDIHRILPKMLFSTIISSQCRLRLSQEPQPKASVSSRHPHILAILPLLARSKLAQLCNQPIGLECTSGPKRAICMEPLLGKFMLRISTPINFWLCSGKTRPTNLGTKSISFGHTAHPITRPASKLQLSSDKLSAH